MNERQAKKIISDLCKSQERTKPDVYILFESDQWLTKSNFVFLGVFSSPEKAVDALMEEDHLEYKHHELKPLILNYSVVLGNGIGYVICCKKLDEFGELY